MPPLPPDGASRQLPSSIVAREFGEVNVRRRGPSLEVSFTVLMEPQGDLAEGWRTGVALDASSSMKNSFGRGLRGRVPDDVVTDYLRKGWLEELDQDGRRVLQYQPQGYEDAVARGYLSFTRNLVEPLARDFISYLASNLDVGGGSTVIYWACDDGSAYEVLGDFTARQVRSLSFAGPRQKDFGNGTRLLPAVRYFAERFSGARRGMYLFLTDGRLDDLAAVKEYTLGLCREIASGRRNPIKCVLIGVGEQVDPSQLVELDDLQTGTDVDVWDHKIAREMRDLVEIFAEVVDENHVIAPDARIFDADGRVVKRFRDGMPAKVSFSMPATSGWFELEVNGERVRQRVV